MNDIDFSKLPGVPTRLVISGGGPRGIGILGGLHYIYEKGGLDKITEYWGTSIGSVIILLLSIGYTPFEIFHKLFVLEEFASATDLQSVLETSALCPIEILGDRVKEFMREKLRNRFGKDCDPTFFDLYIHTKKRINIIGTNTSTMRGECFNVDNYPLMKISDAIEISCDLPYLFTKKLYNDQIYVDGGFINNYPIDMADDGIHYILGISASASQNEKTPATDFVGWIYRLLYIPIMELYRQKLDKLSEKCIHVEITVDVGLIDISVSQKKKIEAFSSGYQQTRRTLAELQEYYYDRKHRFDYIDNAKPGSSWDIDFDL